MRDFCPLCPRPEVFPRPEPCPRPTLFRPLRDPGGGVRLSNPILLLSAIGLLDLLYLDHVCDDPYHAPDGRVVILHHYRLVMPKPERFQRSLLGPHGIAAAADLPDS